MSIFRALLVGAVVSMKYRKRIYYTETDKGLMWDRRGIELFARS